MYTCQQFARQVCHLSASTIFSSETGYPSLNCTHEQKPLCFFNASSPSRWTWPQTSLVPSTSFGQWLITMPKSSRTTQSTTSSKTALQIPSLNRSWFPRTRMMCPFSRLKYLHISKKLQSQKSPLQQTMSSLPTTLFHFAMSSSSCSLLKTFKKSKSRHDPKWWSLVTNVCFKLLDMFLHQQSMPWTAGTKLVRN